LRLGLAKIVQQKVAESIPKHFDGFSTPWWQDYGVEKQKLFNNLANYVIIDVHQQSHVFAA
jgi:hypothetical protein